MLSHWKAKKKRPLGGSARAKKSGLGTMVDNMRGAIQAKLFSGGTIKSSQTLRLTNVSVDDFEALVGEDQLENVRTRVTRKGGITTSKSLVVKMTKNSQRQRNKVKNFFLFLCRAPKGSFEVVGARRHDGHVNDEAKRTAGIVDLLACKWEKCSIKVRWTKKEKSNVITSTSSHATYTTALSIDFPTTNKDVSGGFVNPSNEEVVEDLCTPHIVQNERSLSDALKAGLYWAHQNRASVSGLEDQTMLHCTNGVGWTMYKVRKNLTINPDLRLDDGKPIWPYEIFNGCTYVDAQLYKDREILGIDGACVPEAYHGYWILLEKRPRRPVRKRKHPIGVVGHVELDTAKSFMWEDPRECRNGISTDNLICVVDNVVHHQVTNVD